MKKIFLLSMLLVYTVCAFAQKGTGTFSPLEIESERSHIQEERLREESQYQTEEAACYKKFVVTDCIRQLRVQRRAVLDKLRKRELLINDAERQRKAQEQLNQIKDKSSEQRLEEDALKRLEARKAQKEREIQAAQKLNLAPVSVLIKTTKVLQEAGSKAGNISNEQQRYNEKLKEAQSHRLSQEKAIGEKGRSTAKPLPTPLD